MVLDRVDWAQIASDFKWDGSLREIRVPGTSVADWQHFLDALRRIAPSFTFTIDKEAADLPILAEEALACRQTASPLLSFQAGDVRLNCHFFSADEIELDLDPRDVTGDIQLAALADLMGWMADTIGRLVVLTSENLPAAVIAGRSPGALEAVWWPPG